LLNGKHRWSSASMSFGVIWASRTMRGVKPTLIAAITDMTHRPRRNRRIHVERAGGSAR
jgi:hypothetical protein